MDLFEHPDDARHSDRQTADGCLRPRTRCTVRSQEQTLVGGGRRRLASFVAFHGVPRGVVIEQKSATADARGLRFDQTEHHLRRDGRIDGVTARCEDAGAGLRRFGVRRCDHRVAGAHRGVGRGAAAGALRTVSAKKTSAASLANDLRRCPTAVGRIAGPDRLTRHRCFTK